MRCATLALLLSVVLVPQAARGQPAGDPATEARTLFEQGVAALQQGSYTEALEVFKRSYRLQPRPILLFNIGMCQWELRDLVAAREVLLRYLADAGEAAPAEVRTNADRILGEIERMTCTIAVQVNQPGARVFLDGVDVGAAPAVELTTLPPGDHVVDARLDGFETASATVTLDAGEIMTVSLALTPRVEVPPTPGGELPPSVTETAGTATDGGGGILSNGWFWASVAVAGAATLTAVVTGSLALKSHDDYEGGGARDAELRDTTVNLGIATDVMIGLAAAGAVGALVVFLTMDDPGEAEAEPALAEVAILPGRLVVTW